MNNKINIFKNIPVNANAIYSLFPELSDKQQKLRQLVYNKEIIRIKRNLYIVHPKHSPYTISTELIGNHIYTPSYISMETALRYYGLIPEAVYINRSMTLKRSKRFSTPFGLYEYFNISKECFHIGIRVENSNGINFIIASPEKALCDLIAENKGINLRYIKETKEYLTNYLRLDMDAFYNFDISILSKYAENGKKSNSIKTLIKLIEYERNIRPNAI